MAIKSKQIRQRFIRGNVSGRLPSSQGRPPVRNHHRAHLVPPRVLLPLLQFMEEGGAVVEDLDAGLRCAGGQPRKTIITPKSVSNFWELMSMMV